MLQSAILLALGRPAAVRPLLQQAQHLADSLHISLRSYGGNCELLATWARYYTATGAAPRALQAWQAALRQARQEQQSALSLDYLRALAAASQQQGQPAQAATYGLAALALFPNPAHGTATLTGTQPGAATTVLDALGAKCWPPLPIPLVPPRWCCRRG